MTEVLLVAEHSPTVGLGHLRRALALAAELRRRGATAKVLAFGPVLPGHAWGEQGGLIIEPAAEDDGARVERIREMVRAEVPKSVVIDVLRMREETLDAIKQLGRTMAVIGEPTDGRIPCDLLIHASATESPAVYAGRVSSDARLLLDLRYAVLRPEVTERRVAVPPTSPTVRRIFVGLGGGDVCGDSARVLEGLHGAETRTRIDLVLPPWPCRTHRTEWDARVHVHTNGEDPIGLMADADLAVTGGGVTSLELACLGVPTLIVVRAPNQRRNAEVLSREGAALNLGPVGTLKTGELTTLINRLEDPTVRDSMRHRARALVDGLGVQRVAQELLR